MALTAENSYLFDSTVFIEALHRQPVARQIMFEARDKRIPVGYSVITEAELWVGIKPPWTVQEHEILLRPFKRYYINVTIARRGGQLRGLLLAIPQGQRQGLPGLGDCIIAATAEYYGLTVCTRNRSHFEAIQKVAGHSFKLQLYSA
jgi:predicted nucleic acid-binding protein